MSFRVVKFLIASLSLVFFVLLFKVLPLLEFNNDHWLPKHNKYQRDLNYLEAEFQPGFGSLVVLKFPNTFFQEETVSFFREFKTKVEAVPHVFKINSPSDPAFALNAETKITIIVNTNFLNITTCIIYKY